MPTHTDVVVADGRKRYRGLYLNVAAAFGPPAEFPATHLRHRSHVGLNGLAAPTSAPGLGCAEVPACDGLGVPSERKVGADPERRELHNGEDRHAPQQWAARVCRVH